MARRSSQAKISLFPFLAVLVCTMGALILLLLVTTRRMNQNQAAAVAAIVDNAIQDTTDLSSQQLTEDAFVVTLEETRRRSATAKAAAAPQTVLSIALLPPAPISAAIQEKKREQIHQLQAQLESEQNRQTELLAQMQAIKAGLQTQAADSSQYVLQMQELSHLKAQHAQLNQQLQSRELELAELREELDRDSESVEDAESLLKARESALLNLRKLVQDIPEEGAAGTDQTIVEFTNSTGTHRSPIILDVSDAGFAFLPSQVRITEQDMEGFPGNDNPLLAGVLAIHEHRHAQSTTIKPYVLLLVRPNGSMPFYAAQRTLTDAGIHFGYELLEQDRKIAAGPLQPSEAAALRQSILAALNRRETLYRGLIAEVDQLKESLAARKAAQVGERTVQMTPDGRFLMPDEQGSNSEALFAAQNEGRFYAGGQAPPPGSLTRRHDLSETNDLSETVTQVPTTESRTMDAASPSASEFTEANAAETVIAKAFASSSPAGSQARSGSEFGEVDLLRGKGSATANTEVSGAANPEESIEFPVAQMPTEEASEADVNQLRDSLRMSPDLYGNLGVPAHRLANQTINSAPATASVHPPSMTNESLADHPREPTGWSDSGTAPANLTPRTASPAQELSAAQQPLSGEVVLNPQSGNRSGGNGSGNSPSTDSESFLKKFMQRVEEVKGQRAPDPMLVQLLQKGRMQIDDSGARSSDDSSGLVDHDQSDSKVSDGGNPFSEAPFEPKSEAVPQGTATLSENSFNWAQSEDRLQATETASDPQPQPRTDSPAWPTNPISVSRQAEPGSSQASERPRSFAMFPDDTRFPATAESQPTASTAASRPTVPEPAQTQQVYYVIRVFVEPERLTIGDYEAVDTVNWDADQRLAMTLEVVSATMDEVWSSVRKDALPAVRFLVAPGAEAIQAALSQQLATVQIPTRGVLKVSAEMTADRFFSDVSLPSQTTAAASESAEAAAVGRGPVSKGSL